jgi:hypothetical protein
VRATSKRLTVLVGLLLLACLVTAGCSASPFSIAGMWKDADGTTRTFRADGTCMNVAPIDIGGPPPTYDMSEKAGANGRYSLVVAQGGLNEWTFSVKFVNNDEITIYESASAMQPMYGLKRQ